jgi:hypothetical protein
MSNNMNLLDALIEALTVYIEYSTEGEPSLGDEEGKCQK